MIQSLWIDGPLPGVNELIAAAKSGRGRGYSCVSCGAHHRDGHFGDCELAALLLVTPPDTAAKSSTTPTPPRKRTKPSAP